MNRRNFWLVLFLLLAFAVASGIMRNKSLQLSTIVPYIRPQIVSFTATPRQIRRGEPVTLSWATNGTTMVSIESLPQFNRGRSGGKKTGLPPWGTMTVQPEEDMVYILTCDVPKGEPAVSSRVWVQVLQADLTRRQGKAK
ncbi:MAG TPA: hypothetical protein VN519_06105 [Bryobacteraceae bacterium]|nr:hypothetical protein [Bryobacteraceae bacterium]